VSTPRGALTGIPEQRNPTKELNVTTSTIGLIAGLLLGVAAAVGGFGGFLIALVLGVVGYLVGANVDGEINLGQLWGGGRRRG